MTCPRCGKDMEGIKEVVMFGKFRQINVYCRACEQYFYSEILQQTEVYPLRKENR